MAGKDPVVSTTSPEPLADHSAYFDAQAKREKDIRQVMTEKGVDWPAAVKIVDAVPDTPDPLAARVATLEAALSKLLQDFTDEKNAVKELAHFLQARIEPLEAAAKAGGTDKPADPGTVQ